MPGGRPRRRQGPPPPPPSPPPRRRLRSRSPVDRLRDQLWEQVDVEPRRQRREATPAPSPRVQPPAQPPAQPLAQPPAQPGWWEAPQQAPVAQANVQQAAQPQANFDPGLLTMLYEKIENLERKMLMKGDHIDTLHLTVPVETRQKIWAGTFVDLSTLLVKNYQKLDDDADKKLCGIQDKEGNITLKNVKKNKRNLSIDEWTTAFHTFISVYHLKHADELQGILAYAELIRGAARDHPNSNAWRLYDELFRTKKASDPTRPWGMVDNQLWLALFCKPVQSNSFENPKGSDKNKHGFCFKFNSEKGCEMKRCNYAHKCSTCEASSHGSSTCFKNGYTKNLRKNATGKSEQSDKSKSTGSDFDKFKSGNKNQSSLNHSFRTRQN